MLPLTSRLLKNIRETLWPRMGYRRYAVYLTRRTQRLAASPHAIAAGIASGAAVSIFPFIGFHFMLGFVLAYFTRGNMLAAAIGTAAGNPITFPIFFAATYQIGSFIWPGDTSQAEALLEGQQMTDIMSQLFTEGAHGLWPVLRSMIIGAVPLSILCWVALYFVVKVFVTRSRARRAARRAARAAAEAAAAAAGQEPARPAE